jgi:hypothetical protein
MTTIISKILILVFFTSCLIDDNRDKEGKNDTLPNVSTKDLPPINPRFVKNLSLIDESKFSKECRDSLTTIDYQDLNGLPEIMGIDFFNHFDGKYYCNRTFNRNFKTYIFYIYEGGDSGPSLTLMNTKEDTLIVSKVLWVEHAWERGKGSTRTIFNSDSVFTILQNGISGDEVEDSITIYRIHEIYKIAINGGLELLNRNEEKRNEIFSVERWNDLMIN